MITVYTHHAEVQGTPRWRRAPCCQSRAGVGRHRRSGEELFDSNRTKALWLGSLTAALQRVVGHARSCLCSGSKKCDGMFVVLFPHFPPRRRAPSMHIHRCLRGGRWAKMAGLPGLRRQFSHASLPEKFIGFVSGANGQLPWFIG